MNRLALAVDVKGERYIGEIDDRTPTPKVLYHRGRSFEVLMTMEMCPHHEGFAHRWRSQFDVRDIPGVGRDVATR